MPSTKPRATERNSRSSYDFEDEDGDGDLYEGYSPAVRSTSFEDETVNRMQETPHTLRLDLQFKMFIKTSIILVLDMTDRSKITQRSFITFHSAPPGEKTLGYLVFYYLQLHRFRTHLALDLRETSYLVKNCDDRDICGRGGGWCGEIITWDGMVESAKEVVVWGKDKAPTSAGFDGSQQSYSPQAGPTTGGFPGTTRQSTWRKDQKAPILEVPHFDELA
ncbi:hypothetical protein EAF04_003617 [Stromatinia cepivora]|nr:hypothetical protein EAF04_003617 [Stromatinia cepivora]